jgi:transitional endoplasmic reticulum ATPase
MAMRESKNADQVSMRHFEAALKVVRPSSSKDVMKWYEDFMRSKDSLPAKWHDPGVYR